jgi:hypothetical protein
MGSCVDGRHTAGTRAAVGMGFWRAVGVVEGWKWPSWQPRSSSAVDSLSDALFAGFETRCVGCCAVVGGPECVSRFTPLVPSRSAEGMYQLSRASQRKSGR